MGDSLGCPYFYESSAQNYFPLTKDAVAERGWRWKEKENTACQITKRADELPDDIKDVDERITKEIIECAECMRAYHIIPQELELLRRFGFPIPRICFECRHQARLARMNPMRSQSRACAKCGKEIITNYSPKQLDIVYCETCYQEEVI